MKKTNFYQCLKRYSISFILVALLSAPMFSCTNSDDSSNPAVTSTPTENQHLSGRWNLYKKSVNGQLQSISDCERQYNYYQFSSDGGAIVGRFRMYTVGNTYYCEQSTSDGEYDITGDVLTYTRTGAITKYNIVSANELTIKLEMFYYENVNGQFTVPQNERVTDICNRAE